SPAGGDTPAIPQKAPAKGPLASAPPLVASAAPAQDEYARAVSLLRSRLYSEATAAFENVAAAHGAHADLALYELGRIEQLHLGNSDRALTAYLRYQREYPHGTLLHEVELSTIELKLQRRELDDARDLMNRFLDHHPKSERAPEVHLLRGDVLREQ